MPNHRLLLSTLLASVMAIGAALSASGATFVVPSDQEMFRRANAVVIATALPSYSQLNAEGGIETVTPFSIEETVKGHVPSVFDVVEPGGEFGGRITAIAGVPRFEAGVRTLLFLTRTRPNAWSATEITLGKFSFAEGTSGEQLLIRDEGGVEGWNPDLTPHQERPRSASRFLDFLRATSQGATAPADYFVPDSVKVRHPAPHAQSLGGPQALIAPFTATSYTMIMSGAMGGRWTGFPSAVTFFSGTTAEPGAPGGGTTAIDAAFASWNGDTASNVNYVDGGTDNGTHTQGLHAADGANTILFERDLSSYGISPFTCSGNSFSGTLGIGGVTSASGTNVLNGETFVTTLEADVEMNKGLANCTVLFNNGDWNSALTHEVGHTLGFRHADQNRPGNAACSTDPSLECSNQAIMKSFISPGLNGALQAWDQHAVQAVYPGGSPPPPPPPPPCTPPAITTQPPSGTIRVGQGATLSVGATGTSLAYQWYIGSPGVTTNPINGAVSSSVTVTPGQTTTFWVQVSNSCGSVNSSGSVITVIGVPPAASLFVITPCRLLDTRGGAPIPANGVRNVMVTGVCGVATGATSLAANVTVVAPSDAAFATVYPGPSFAARPNVSTINFTANRTLANNARITIGADGTVNIFNAASTPLNFLIDVSGYFK